MLLDARSNRIIQNRCLAHGSGSQNERKRRMPIKTTVLAIELKSGEARWQKANKTWARRGLGGHRRRKKKPKIKKMARGAVEFERDSRAVVNAWVVMGVTCPERQEKRFCVVWLERRGSFGTASIFSLRRPHHTQHPRLAWSFPHSTNSHFFVCSSIRRCTGSWHVPSHVC